MHEASEIKKKSIYYSEIAKQILCYTKKKSSKHITFNKSSIHQSIGEKSIQREPHTYTPSQNIQRKKERREIGTNIRNWKHQTNEWNRQRRDSNKKNRRNTKSSSRRTRTRRRSETKEKKSKPTSTSHKYHKVRVFDACAGHDNNNNKNIYTYRRMAATAVATFLTSSSSLHTRYSLLLSTSKHIAESTNIHFHFVIIYHVWRVSVRACAWIHINSLCVCASVFFPQNFNFIDARFVAIFVVKCFVCVFFRWLTDQKKKSK